MKIDIQKVYRERVQHKLTEKEQTAVEAALAAPLMTTEEIKRLLQPTAQVKGAQL